MRWSEQLDDDEETDTDTDTNDENVIHNIINITTNNNKATNHHPRRPQPWRQQSHPARHRSELPQVPRRRPGRRVLVHRQQPRHQPKQLSRVVK